MLRYIFLYFILFLPNVGIAIDLFAVDNKFLHSDRFTKGITVNVPVSRYYPANKNSALYKVLKQAQNLTTNISYMNRDGIPYKSHNWNQGSDRANLKKGIDCSRAIWFAFTRAGLPYNNSDRYLATFAMWKDSSDMKHNFKFNSCSVNDLRLGDVLVYRGTDSKGRIAGHTVMVLDPKKELAWGSHGWDKSVHKDTGVEVQKVLPAGKDWRYWDQRKMRLKACWRHKDFSKKQSIPSNNSGQYPETKNRKLTQADLQDKTKYELWIMRNEMFARYGYRFKNEELAAYFKAWYKSNNRGTNYIYSKRFSNLERNNLKLIIQHEKNSTSGNGIIKPIDNLFKAWSELNVKFYMQQWSKNEDVLQTARNVSRSYDQLRNKRIKDFKEYKTVTTKYSIKTTSITGNQATVVIKHDMSFKRKNGRRFSEQATEKYVLIYNSSANRWLIKKNTW